MTEKQEPHDGERPDIPEPVGDPVLVELPPEPVAAGGTDITTDRRNAGRLHRHAKENNPEEEHTPEVKPEEDN